MTHARTVPLCLRVGGSCRGAGCASARRSPNLLSTARRPAPCSRFSSLLTRSSWATWSAPIVPPGRPPLTPANPAWPAWTARPRCLGLVPVRPRLRFNLAARPTDRRAGRRLNRAMQALLQHPPRPVAAIGRGPVAGGGCSSCGTPLRRSMTALTGRRLPLVVVARRLRAWRVLALIHRGRPEGSPINRRARLLLFHSWLGSWPSTPGGAAGHRLTL